MFFSPAMNDFYAAALADGFARSGARHSRATFDVAGGPLAIVPDDDIERAADRIRPSLALYIGGMGPRARNFHNEVFVRMVEDVALIGPWAKITEELGRWKQTVLTTMLVNCDPSVLPSVLDLVRE